jgi:hypothetical protein
MSEVVEPLSIGAVIGGHTQRTRAWSAALGELTLDIAEARTGVTSALNVNVVFHVPGDILKPDYSGVRTGSFSRKLSLLMVQVALPEEPPADIRAALRMHTLEALAEAERWAKKKGIADDLETLKGLVRYVQGREQVR